MWCEEIPGLSGICMLQRMYSLWALSCLLSSNSRNKEKLIVFCIKSASQSSCRVKKFFPGVMNAWEILDSYPVFCLAAVIWVCACSSWPGLSKYRATLSVPCDLQSLQGAQVHFDIVFAGLTCVMSSFHCGCRVAALPASFQPGCPAAALPVGRIPHYSPLFGTGSSCLKHSQRAFAKYYC